MFFDSGFAYEAPTGNFIRPDESVHVLKLGSEMLKINDFNGSMYCIQIPNYYRKNLVKLLEVGLHGFEPFEMPCEKYKLTINPTAKFLRVVVQDQSIVIDFPKMSLQELIVAIEEHIHDISGLPLDHSLEAVGSKFIPENIEEVVIETID